MNPDQPYRILLVEDDKSLGAMIHDYLTNEGCDVAIETRGDTAVERIPQEAPDVVILDVNLPGMDGIAVCRTVRHSYAGPILILTARGDELDEIIGLEVGADDYLHKPIKPRMLLARLRAHLRAKPSAEGTAEATQLVVGGMTIDSAKRLMTQLFLRFYGGVIVILVAAAAVQNFVAQQRNAERSQSGGCRMTTHWPHENQKMPGQ